MASVLKSIYFEPNNPASFGGVDRLLEAGKKTDPELKKHDVEEFLRQHDAYTFHKNVRFKHKTAKTKATAINEHWQADLSDLSRYSDQNENNKFLLFVIDVYSRYLWIEPLINKKPATVKEGFEHIFEDAQAQCAYLATDQGLEFCSGEMKKMLTDRHITHFHMYGANKCGIVERVQRTIKTRMFRYFTHAKQNRYIDALHEFVASYNQSFHRG